MSSYAGYFLLGPGLAGTEQEVAGINFARIYSSCCLSRSRIRKVSVQDHALLAETTLSLYVDDVPCRACFWIERNLAICTKFNHL
jgi:hypothetical protein